MLVLALHLVNVLLSLTGGKEFELLYVRTTLLFIHMDSFMLVCGILMLFNQFSD